MHLLVCILTLVVMMKQWICMCENSFTSSCYFFMINMLLCHCLILVYFCTYSLLTCILLLFSPKETGGGALRPPSTFRAITLQRAMLSPRHFMTFFLSSFPHILTPNLWRPGVQFWSYVTFCTCTSDRKWLQNVILCTKSMQIEFFRIVHIYMLIFTLNGWN